jgi:SAM-dependent methyltransferase
VTIPDQARSSRFGFGENWSSFVEIVSEERIREAERSLATMLDAVDLNGKSFLDIGCGSGLSSLAAARLGAERVRSFDFDSASVRAAQTLQDRYVVDASWTIERGDATDEAYCAGLGTFDVVYAWGVLHHTGAMWKAMANAIDRVAEGGLFFVAIYNDQGRTSGRWRTVKKIYNRLPGPVRVPYAVAVMLPMELQTVARAILRGRMRAYVSGWRRVSDRGMSRWHDLLDWVGGYPFEVAKPEEVFRFCRERGLELVGLTTCGGGLGNNQFVFRRTS